jgi:hypothetical protein
MLAGAVADVVEIWMTLSPAFSGYRHLAGGEQSPEQHRSGVRRRQHGLRFDPPLELFMQTFNGV